MMNYTTDDLGKDQKLTPKHRLRLSVQKMLLFFFTPASPSPGFKQNCLMASIPNS